MPLETIRETTRFPGRLWPGQVLRDQYEIGSLAGVGGMGAVYRGRHRITRQDVAIKVLWRDLSDRTAEVRRFKREARAASGLTHPNTVRVYDFGRDDRTDSIFMVMEYLVGQKLSDAQRTEPRMSPDRAVQIVAQICKALEEAHGKNIVHRDLKPDNIFLQEVPGERDFVKVLDFGLAKFVGGDVERDSLTRTGYVVGSPEYMSPEQAIGSDVGPAADIYSCGIMLYELLSGDLPFDAETTAQVLRQHIMDRPPPLKSDGLSPIAPALERVIMRCLAKEPADRPPSAKALRELLLSAHDRRRRRAPSEPVEPLVLTDDFSDTISLRKPTHFDRRGQHMRTTADLEDNREPVLAPGAVAGEVLRPDGSFELVATQAQIDDTDAPTTAMSPDDATTARSRQRHGGAGPSERQTAAQAPTREWPAWLLVAAGAAGAGVVMAVWRLLG